MSGKILKRWLSAALTLAMVFTLMLTPALASTEPGGDTADPAAEAAETAEETEATEAAGETAAEEAPEDQAAEALEPAGETPAQEEEDGAPEGEAGEDTPDGDTPQTMAFYAVTLSSTGGGYSSISDALADAKDGDTITLHANLEENVRISSGKNVTLDLNGFILTSGSSRSDIIVNNGTLTLKDSSVGGTGAITGGSSYTAYDVIGCGVINYGTFIMESGTISGNSASTIDLTRDGAGGGVTNYGSFTMYGGKISGNSVSSRSTSPAGGGVYNGGEFIMEGGEISGNSSDRYGGGVFNEHSATFEMNGGTISGNSASDAGGGVYNDYGDFTMNGGTISDNIITSTSGSWCNGGGVFSYGSFTMTGGTISGNRAGDGGGISVVNYFEMTGGEITGNAAIYNGGGMETPSNCTVVMTGGVISGNTANNGGGIYVLGDLTMTGGTISDNTASNAGGGVFDRGTFNLDGSAEISGNTASDGGGVYVRKTFTMNGGEISGNTAIDTGGGGVFVTELESVQIGDFTMNGGEISGNTASDGTGGGVYVEGGSFTMYGGAVYRNTAAYGAADFRHVGGTSSLIPAGDMSCDDVTILGWYSDAAGARYADAATPQEVTGVSSITGTADLIAAYEITVTYALEDGTELETVVINPSKGEILTISDDSGMEFSDDVCYLKAWNTEKDGTGEAYELGGTAVFTRNTTLYAQTEGHDWAGLDTKQPTCTEDGETTFTCQNPGCDAFYTEKTGTLGGHIWDPDADDTEADWIEDEDGNIIGCVVTLTCQRVETGWNYYVCGETMTIECEVTAVTTESSCTEDGEKVYTAVGSATDEYSGEEVTVEVSKTEAIPATGHTVVKDAAVSPTCTESGLTEGSHCSVCNEVLVAQEVIPALGHEWDEGTVTKAPTCTDAGELTYTCSRCRDTKTETIAALDHDYVEEVVASTCTEDGYTMHTCSRCGYIYYDNFVQAPGHTVEIDEAVSPTCTESGLTEGSHCSVCEEVLVAQEVIPALGHDWVETDIVSSGEIDRSETDIHMECSRCGETMDEYIVEETVSTEIEAHSTIEWSDLITSEELDALFENGAEIDFDLTVAALTDEDVPEEDAALVEELLSDQEFTVLYLDINAIMDIFHADGTEEARSFTETLNPITITVVIPEELLEADGDTYVIIRVHDGEAEALDTEEEDGTLTFTTDKFSTYAIVKLAESTEEEPGSSEEPTMPTEPDTGDDTGSDNEDESGNEGSDTGDNEDETDAEGSDTEDTGDNGDESDTEDTDSEDHIPGDVNGDGKVNITDAQDLLQYVNKRDVFVIYSALDVDGDGEVQISDVQLLLKYVNKQDVVIY